MLVNAFAALAVAVAAAAPATAEEPVRLLVLGDSLTAGYGLAARDALPARLEAALRRRGQAVTVINAGVSGDTTAGGRARLAWSLGASPRPDAAIVELGGNDGLRGIEPTETRANLSAILDRLAVAGLPVLLAGMKAPRNLGEDYVREFDAVFPDLARQHGVLFYPFLLEGVALDPALNQPDGIHPNARGVERIVRGLLPLAEELIARTRAAAREGAP
ncbi:MAG TPA: arylesterase [Alphaproteobacteria bacterium]